MTVRALAVVALLGVGWLASTLALTGCSSDEQVGVALATPTPDARALRLTSLATIYGAASRHDEAALLAMPSASPSASPDPAIELALLTIDRGRYERAFVQNYPATHDALAIDYGSAFARARVVPSGALFPIAALGAIAIRSGGGDAFGKLLGGVAVTDGSIGDAYRTQARHVIAAVPPATTIDAFVWLPPASRLAAISTLGWCLRPPTALLAYHPTPAPSANLQATPSPFGVAASPGASTPGSAASSRRPPTLVEVAAVQEAIGNAAALDCRSTRRARPGAGGKSPNASAHTASRRTASPAPRNH